MDNNNMEFENTMNTIEEKNVLSESTANENAGYGAVYTPNPDGDGYICQKYSADSSENKHNEVSSKKRSEKKRTGTSFGIIAISVAICVLLSAAAAFGAALFAGSLIAYPELPEDTMGYQEKDPPARHDNVYIDISPNYTEETVVIGSQLSMEEAIKSVKDSVVEITTESLKSGFGGFSQYVVGGAGSGVIISSGGYIITNNHVVEGANNIVVRLTDGSQHKATLIGADSKSDVAVISITPPEGVILTPAVIGNSDSLNLGQTVIAIGNPLGELGGTVTDGIISCLAREIAIDGSGTMTLLQTNAAVSPGNSGGGLFDLHGRLIGVVNAKFSGDGVEGISFAIPMNTAYDVAKQLIEKGYVSGRPALGVGLSQVEYGSGIFGVTGYQVVVADPKNVKELKVNDWIIGIDNMQVSTLGEISDIVSSHKIGDVLTLTVVRDRRYVEVEVTLVEYIPDVKEEKSQDKQNRG